MKELAYDAADVARMGLRCVMTDHAAKRYWTDEELRKLPDDGYEREIVDGEMVVSPAGSEHGAAIMAIAGPLFVYVSREQLGRVLDGQTGCRMASGDLFSPDVSFVSQARWEAHRKAGETFFHGAPELVVEVLSPDDSRRVMKRKLAQYFANGARLAWVVELRKARVEVHRTAEAAEVVEAGGVLEGENIVPGFRLELSQVFV